MIGNSAQSRYYNAINIKIQLSGFRPRRFQRAVLATRQLVQVPLSSAG